MALRVWPNSPLLAVANKLHVFIESNHGGTTATDCLMMMKLMIMRRVMLRVMAGVMAGGMMIVVVMVVVLMMVGVVGDDEGENDLYDVLPKMELLGAGNAVPSAGRNDRRSFNYRCSKPSQLGGQVLTD